jgi:fucose 4-O-acetylase-like acetyltransferase
MSRIVWLDAARGIGIILVVIGHALGGLIDSPLGAGQNAFRSAFFAIYSFHMPLFFLLSGLLVPQRIDTGGLTFLRGLISTMAWPYFLWSVIQHSVVFSLGALANHPENHYWTLLLSLPWEPFSQFWFLYALFWMHVLAALWLKPIGREAFVLLALALKALILLLPLPVAIKLLGHHMFFYAVGVWLGTAGLEQMLFRHKPIFRALLLPLAAVIIMATYFTLSRFAPDLPIATAASPKIANLAWRFPVMAAAIFGVAASLSIARFEWVSGAEWLGYLGRMSMPIFILHIMFIAGLRIVLIRYQLVTDVYLILAMLVMVGLIGPLIVERITRRTGLNRILGLG